MVEAGARVGAVFYLDLLNTRKLVLSCLKEYCAS
jgi:hypothetical protein